MKNWTINEAVKTINEGVDLEGIKEITSHFPIFALAAAKNDLACVATLMGDKFTLNRLAKEPIADVEEDQAADGGSDRSNGKPLEDMTAKELMKLCDAKGIKVPHYGKNKQFYLEQLQGTGAKEATEEPTEEWSGEGQADPYEGKTAKELHAMCKERGIKADIRKPPKFYADLLRKYDEAEADDGNDDWAEEETTTKGKGKVVHIDNMSKASDDDWDI